MAKLTSEKLTNIETLLSELQKQVSQLIEEQNAERQKLFCEAEGLIPNESLITAEGKVYLYLSVDRNNDECIRRFLDGSLYPPTAFCYQMLSSGKPSTTLKEVRRWSKVA